MPMTPTPVKPPRVPQPPPKQPIPTPVKPPRVPEPPKRPDSKQNRPFIGGYKKGGKVKKTGVALVHKGEHVVSKGGHRKAGRHKKATRKT